jgi:hypothetical protein
MAVEEEQERGHALREGEDPGVVGFVELKTARVEGLREEEGLAEGEGEAFSGDGVDGAGGVSDEGDVVAGDAAEAAGEGEAAAFGGGGWCGGELVAECGEGVEELRKADFGMRAGGVTGHGGDTDFFRTGGGDVGLAEGAPVDFYVGTPRLNAVVGAESEAAAGSVCGFEVGPGADAGGGSVGSDEPLVVEGSAGQGWGLVFIQDDWSVPCEADA